MLTADEIARLAAIVPPPVGTLSLDGLWLKAGDRWAGVAWPEGGWPPPPQPDPLCPAWQGACLAWLLERRLHLAFDPSACGYEASAAAWGTLSRGDVTDEDGATALCRLVLEVAGKGGEP